jgi:peptidoglycan/LPS O-acetylase OafA/YrhL
LTSLVTQRLADGLPRYDFIDALRGWAVVGVVIVHTAQWVSPGDALLPITGQGARGVQLFYLVSALTLCLSMRSRWDRDARPVLSFFVRRFFRIAPMFYLAIAFYFLRQGFEPRYFAPDGIEVWHVLSTIFFLHGWHPTSITSVVPGGWSIAVEFTMYMMFPLLFLGLTTLKRAVVFTVVSLLVSVVIRSAVEEYWTARLPADQSYLAAAFAYRWLPAQLPIFGFGFVAYHTFRSRRWSEVGPGIGVALVPLSLVMMVALALVPGYAMMPKHLLYGFAFLAFTLGLAAAPSRVLVNRISQHVGRVSFSVYLTHFAVIGALAPIGGRLIGPEPLQFALAAAMVGALSVGLSTLTHRWIEVPGQAAGRGLITWLDARPVWPLSAAPAGPPALSRQSRGARDPRG